MHWLESVRGLPDVEALRLLARPHVDRRAFLCGPEPFMATTREALRAEGFPRRSVHLERFVSLAADPPSSPKQSISTDPPSATDPPSTGDPPKATDSPSTGEAGEPSRQDPPVVEVLLDGQEHAFDWPAAPGYSTCCGCGA